MPDAPQPELLARALARTIGSHFGDGQLVDAREVVIAAAAVINGYLEAVDDPVERRRLRADAVFIIADADTAGMRQ